MCAPDRRRAARLQPAEPDDEVERGRASSPGARPPRRTSRRGSRDAIENWGVRYFKWDFMAWLDCAGQGDIYAFREALLAMLDRLQAKYPDVTFQIDETNDYRLFPYESVSRGPSWFQNGTPESDQLLHNLWNLSAVRAGVRRSASTSSAGRLGAAPGGDADGGGAALAT